MPLNKKNDKKLTSPKKRKTSRKAKNLRGARLTKKQHTITVVISLFILQFPPSSRPPFFLVHWEWWWGREVGFFFFYLLFFAFSATLASRAREYCPLRWPLPDTKRNAPTMERFLKTCCSCSSEVSCGFSKLT